MLRIVPAFLSLIVAAFFLSRAMKRLIGVVALLVGSAIAFAAGAVLLASLLWSAIRSLRSRGDALEG